MRPVTLILLLIVSIACRADYLVVNRSCTLKRLPDASSRVVQKLSVHDTLRLLQNHQEGGYYRVAVHPTGSKGWVYRTFVRRYSGDLPPRAFPSITENAATEVVGSVQVRIVDVGPGLCNLIKLPDGKYIVYDAGHFRGKGSSTLNQVKQYIPTGSDIEFMVLSHTDADHIGAAAGIVSEYHVKKVIWTGFERSMVSNKAPTASYSSLVAALNKHGETENVNLHELDSTIKPGVKFKYGDVIITFLCGFGKPPATWNLTDKAEMLNAVSIVMKLEYSGTSILFCGDAVGRHRDDPPDALIATEKFLVENAAGYLKSTIIIAPHHGANNGSSSAFVNLVQPEAVIFSAGHQHRHPTQRTAKQYLQYATLDQIFRTDRGDDEGDGEWNATRIDGCSDDYDDDNIQVELLPNNRYQVYYLNPEGSCNEGAED